MPTMASLCWAVPAVKLFSICGFHFLGLFLSLTITFTSGHGGEERTPKLIIVSFDGFRWNYIDRTHTPNFDRIIKEGVHARRGIKSCFITKTLPNHFTLVTGLYEESHGIVANSMFDPELNEFFDVRNDSQVSSPRWFDMGAEPIWVTNQVQSKNGRSGCMQWIGCLAPIKGVTPTLRIPYDPNIDNRKRINYVIEWFTKKPYPINLGLIYFTEPDKTAHHFGPESQQVTDKIRELDEVVGYLLQRLKEEDLLDDVNLIITSDHGFAATGPDKEVKLDDYIRPDSYRLVDSTPVAAILPNEGMEEAIFANLTKGASAAKTFQVYKKAGIPEQYHYFHNRRITPIIVVANEHYSIVHNNSTRVVAGNHGYNNSLQDMHPFFVARGPGLRQGAAVDTFSNVDVYPLMCHLLGLNPAPNNGSLQAVAALLRIKDEKSTVVTFGTYFFVLLVVGSVGGVFLVAACRQHRYLKRMQRTRVITLHGGIKYSTPPVNGGAKVPLLSDTSEEETIP